MPEPTQTPPNEPVITGSTEPESVPAPSPEPNPAPAPEPTAVPASGAEPAPAPAVAEPPSADWRDRRIAQLTARLKETQERLNAAGAPNPEPPAPVLPAPAPALTPADVEARASQIAAAREFDRMCTEVATNGRLAFPDFDSRLGQLKRLQNEADPAVAQAYNSMIAAAVETGEGAKVIHTLGGDLEEASRIMALPPLKMAVELTKLSQTNGRTISGAPKPITPISGTRGSLSEVDPGDPERSDMLSDADWFARRQADVDRKRAAGKEIY